MRRLIALLLLLATPLHAEYYQNPLFRSLHDHENTQNSYKGIGWTVVSNSNHLLVLQGQGYKEVDFPYWMEVILFFSFVLLSGLSGRRFSKMMRYRHHHEERDL